MSDAEFQERVRHSQMPSSLPEEGQVIELPLDMRPGATMRGTLYDTAGNPCAGTVKAKLPENLDGFLSDGYGKADADGTFALHFEKDGPHVFFATGGEFPTTGTVTSEPIDIDLAAPPQDLSFQLIGPGHLRGKVLDSDGRPSAGLQVLALTLKADVGRGSFVVPDEISSVYTREGRGAYWRLATTDAQGKFHFHGLRDDTFVVRAKTDQNGAYPILLTPSPVSSLGPALTLRLARPHLLVRVQDETGQPVVVTCPRNPIQEWPTEPVLQVVPAPEWIREFSSYQRIQQGKVVGKGSVAYDLPVEKEYIVSLAAPGQAVQVARVAMPRDCGRVEQTFVLDRPKPPGELIVRVLDADGNPVESNLSISVLDPESGLSIASRWQFSRSNGPDPWPAKFMLPQGIYRIEVESTPDIEYYHGTLMKPRAWGDYRTTLTIAAGETHELTAQLSAPAWIDLEVLGQVTEADRQGAIEQNPWLANRKGSENFDQEVETYAMQASPQLWRADGYPIDVEFARYGMEGTSAAGTHLYGFLPLGTREKTEALPPGTYKLTVRLPGGRERSKDIVLSPGATLAVSFDFGAE